MTSMNRSVMKVFSMRAWCTGFFAAARSLSVNSSHAILQSQRRTAGGGRRRQPESTDQQTGRTRPGQDVARAGRGAEGVQRGQDAARRVCGEGITPYDLMETVSVAISMRALAFGAGGVFWVAMVVPAAACHAERGGGCGERRLRRGERAEERRREGEKRERREKREEGGERERGESDGDRTGTCA